MKQIILIIFAFLTTFFAFGQTKTLVFYQASQADKAMVLWEKAEESKHLIDTTSNVARINEENLKNYTAIVFLNTSINALSFREAAEVQRFMQAGGGFVGIHSAIEKSYQWLWYKKMIGGVLAETQLVDKVQLSLITNAYLGKTQLPPLWKIEDKPLIIQQLPTYCKPVLLDVMGKTWAWHYRTEEGGKMFYTALGSEFLTYQNPNFIDHIWAGIEEVSAKKLPDYSKIVDTALPSESNFLRVVLSENLENPIALASTPDRNVILVEQNGKVKVYNTQKRITKLAGNIDATQLKAIKLDPEFTQNGYVYTFTETAPSEYKIGRLQMMGDSAVILSDFSSQSSTPISKSITYNYDNYSNEPYRLPKYYDGKTFRYDNDKGFIVETLDEDGNIKNREPFLQNFRFYYIQDMTFGTDGALYFLENNQLTSIDYSDKNRKPIAIASADVLIGNAPLKVKFSSTGSIDYDAKDVLGFEWNFGGTNISREPNPIYTFTKVGNYEIKLQVSDNQGNMSEKILNIQVNKPIIRRR